MDRNIKVLILGSSGMLGHALFNRLSEDFEVFGWQRSDKKITLNPHWSERVITGLEMSDTVAVEAKVRKLKPDYVINCMGVIKQFKRTPRAEFVAVNSMWPHTLDAICSHAGVKLIHFSTDCVFDGAKGNYVESDPPSASDDYGLSKYLGEVISGSEALTLRTSIIGHEIGRSLSLIDWFLTQRTSVQGFRQAIYTGLPTVEVADFLRRYMHNSWDLKGLYHLCSHPISKYDLLTLVGEIYGHKLEIIADDEVRIDRSLNGSKLRADTGVEYPDWRGLVEKMHKFHEDLAPLYLNGMEG
ncbi:MAG: dTDP-4-dehydrorhamnose reductase family protein [Bdellovibrionales bacterium]